ncbi:SURF1 family protein [Sphingomonas sp.]|uniref:SURF1 family protein n=1 Tax=Sphingomonas sp. TaxID=28214 RepID=UPI0025D19CCE|nr:SURF1 family protein [Sphingomonas sp.]
MKRIPIVATVLVALCVAAMIGLGVWQLHRATWKEALIARYAANRSLPPMAFPRLAPVPDDAMFRKSQVNCLRVVGWSTEGGVTPSGQAGYRHIAACSTGAEGPGALVDAGVAADPQFKPSWQGGLVDGIITTEPQHVSLIGKLFGHPVPPRPMLVADRPAPGLAASAPPSTDEISNNHIAYAVQWFLFAGVAAVIYGIALRRRMTPPVTPPSP